MCIHYNETYERITNESAELGDVAESGFIEQRIPARFSELVDLLRGTEPSQSPLPEKPSRHVWFTAYETKYDFRTGDVENRSYHPETNKAARYMARAWRAANAK